MDRGRTGDGEYRALKSRSNTECGPLKLNEDGPCPVLLAISDIYKMAFGMDGVCNRLSRAVFDLYYGRCAFIRPRLLQRLRTGMLGKKLDEVVTLDL
jgi:hypothetical protein